MSRNVLDTIKSLKVELVKNKTKKDAYLLGACSRLLFGSKKKQMLMLQLYAPTFLRADSIFGFQVKFVMPFEFTDNWDETIIWSGAHETRM